MPPKNTYTVTLADTHAHTDVTAGIPATSHADAALSRLQSFENEAAITALLDTDTLTITVTQP
jgi:hypothetical protein